MPEKVLIFEMVLASLVEMPSLESVLPSPVEMPSLELDLMAAEVGSSLLDLLAEKDLHQLLWVQLVVP